VKRKEGRYENIQMDQQNMVGALAWGLRGATTLVVSGLLGLTAPGFAHAGLNRWTTNGPEGGFVQTLAIDPQTPTTLYAGGYGVFKSTDEGESWTAMNNGLLDFPVYALAIDATAPTTVYAGTFGGGIFKSMDGGGGAAGRP
jgi:hypothetical protein